MPVEQCSHGHGWCLRCREPWCLVKSHSTQIDEGQGCFPLCEGCWAALTPPARLPYYHELIGIWIEQGTPKSELPLAAIERAVLTGG